MTRSYRWTSDLAPRQRAQLGHGVPVPGRADDPEPAFEERAGVLRLRITVRRVHVDLAAVDDELVLSARREGERGEDGLRRFRGQERDVMARRVRAGAGVRAGLPDSQQFGDT